MYADIKHLTKLFRGVSRIRESIGQYSLPGHAVGTDWDDLHHAFEQMCGLPIYIAYTAASKDEYARGVYLPYNDKKVILIEDGMEPYRKRYVVVKEMCQLILSEDEYLTPDPVMLVSVLVSEAKKFSETIAPDFVIADEWATTAALELLFPIEHRKSQQELYEGHKKTLFDISAEYHLPEDVIEEAFGPDHRDACQAAWEEIRSEQ